jgi:hypothetical protein
VRPDEFVSPKEDAEMRKLILLTIVALSALAIVAIAEVPEDTAIVANAEVPEDIIQQTRARYLEVYELITGKPLA